MSGEQPLILIVDDELQIRRHLSNAFKANGYRTIEAESGEAALAQASAQPPDAIILDMGLPEMDGVEVVRNIRDWSTVPIIVLSARLDAKGKVSALDAGADDYVTKPFDVGELMARTRVALRHAASAILPRHQGTFIVQDLKIDLVARRVWVGEHQIQLTPLEYRLLVTLAQHAGKVLTHTFLLKEVWGPPHVNDTHYLRVHMANLRGKVEPNPSRPKYILTEQGVGYRLLEE